jgi:DNA polymerase elongation subunit (family B)
MGKILFESAWTKNYMSFERVYNTVSKKSEVRPIKVTSEWYEEDSRGDYESILDNTVKLTKKQGNAKDGRNHWGFIDPIYRNIKDNYWNENQKDTYNKTPRIWYLDIETRVGQNSVGFPVPSKTAEEISMFQIFDSVLNTIILFGVKAWKHQTDYKLEYPVKYIQCENEIDMINKFIQTFQALDPLIIYAWNGNGFDFPYIYNRMKLLGMDTNGLSKYGDVKLKEKQIGHKTIWELTSHGHHFMDMLEIYQKFTFGEQASYSLDYTAEVVLGKKKVDHSEYVAFDDFYTGKYVIPTEPTEKQRNSKIYKEAVAGNWDEVRELAHSDFVYYGAIDTVLTKEIDDAKNFTSLMFMIAEKMGVLVNDSMGTVKPWSKYITNKALLDKQVIPKLQTSEDDVSIKGGFVAVPQVGKHEWIMSSDVNSMYPLLGMVGFNLSPETFIPIHKLPADIRAIILKYYNNEEEQDRFDVPDEVKLKLSELLQKYNYSMGINGAIFTKDKLGMIPYMVQDIYKTRKADKKTMFKYEKRSLEIKEILKQRAS